MGVMPPAAPPGLAFGFTGHSAVGLNVWVLIPESESFVFFFFLNNFMETLFTYRNLHSFKV